MTKKEYFKSIVQTLSNRTVGVIGKLHITPYNIDRLGRVDFRRVPNCGEKTIQELLYLQKSISEFSKKENNNIDNLLTDNPHSFEDYKQLFNLSSRAHNALITLDIHDFASLQKEAVNNFSALRSLRNVGEKTIREIQDYYDYLRHLPLQEEIEIPESTPEYLTYIELKSSYLHTLLSDIYCKQYKELPTNIQNIISTYCASFVELLSANAATINIEDSNKDRRSYIANIIFDFRDNFLLEAKPYLEMSREDLLWHEFFSGKKYLKSEDKIFIRQFTEKENHLPFWYILSCELISPSQLRLRRAYDIFNSCIVFPGTVISFDEIGKKYYLNEMGVRRELLCAMKFISRSVNRLSWKGDKFLKVYPFLENDILTEENFKDLSAKEHIKFDYYKFCYICSFLMEKFEMIDFYSVDGRIVTGLSSGKYLYSCVYNTDLSAFNFARMMQRINSSFKKYTGDYIAIADLCQDITLWKNKKIDQNLIARIVPMVEQLVSAIFQVECSDGLICVKNIQYETDSTSSIKRVLYNCLTASQKPLSLVELFDAYRKEYPESALTMPQQIKNVISQSDQIVAIGGKSLYTLKERLAPQTFKGSLYDCIEIVLRDSGEPMQKEEILSAALKIRPDSTAKSIKTIIASMLRSDRLRLYNNEYIGLPGIEYDSSFIITESKLHFTFEERMRQLYDFVAANGRLPFNGSSEESPLARWYYRIQHETSLTTQQMVELFNFKQATKEAKIPLRVEHEIFRKNCLQYKALVMRMGRLPRLSEEEHLVAWFRRTFNRYSELDDFSKYYFDELVSFLSDFGYELELS